MTCKDCIHYEVCNRWDTWNDEFYTDGNSNKCHNYSKFKDKSRFIELPYGVGQITKMELEIICYEQLGLNYAEEKLKELNK